MIYCDSVGSQPATMAALSKASNIFALWNIGILGSNPTQIIEVCLLLFCVCGQVTALLRADPPSKEFCRLYKIKKLKWREAFHEYPMLQAGATEGR
jgi:hypothetical protein